MDRLCIVRRVPGPAAWPAGIHRRIGCPVVLGRAYGSSAGPGGRGQVQLDTICRRHRRLWPTSLKKELYKRAVQGSFGRGLRSTPKLGTGASPVRCDSVRARNTYGHPREEVLARLGAAHVLTYRTDLEGAATFYLDGTTVVPSLAPAEVH
jgi:hypothetical protein